MLFHSFDFLFVFLPLTLVGFYLIPQHRLKLALLFVHSYLFYAYWNYKFIPLLFASTYVDFYLAKKIAASEHKPTRKKLLLVSITMNLGMLFVFKYFNFFLENLNAFVLAPLGSSSIPLVESIVLPVGISFYTFQSMSYTIDLYRNHSRPYKDFLSFATYVAFFPQLIAGPIIRHSELVTQLQDAVKRRFQHEFFEKGIYLFVLGLAKKVLIADRIALAIDPVIFRIDLATTLEAWACALGYTLQLYFDFSGYSDMAIGLGLMFGLKFPPNFNSPYKARSITDFWRRWHMTLSFWLRDYLYISLGGNRQGPGRTYLNLLITMMLGGLWHGAAWTYFLWGTFHGLLLGIERVLRIEKNAIFKKIWPPLTFFLVVIGWVIFRAEGLDHAMTWLTQMFTLDGGLKLEHFTARTRDRFAVAFVIGLLLVFFAKNTNQVIDHFHPTRRKAFFSALLLITSLLMLTEDSPFLYFQF